MKKIMMMMMPVIDHQPKQPAAQLAVGVVGQRGDSAGEVRRGSEISLDEDDHMMALTSLPR